MFRVVLLAALPACQLETSGLSRHGADATAPLPDSTPVVDAETAAPEVEDQEDVDLPPRVAAKHEYFALDAPLDWYAARDACKRLSAHLVTITTAEELETVKGLGTGDRWLGLRRDGDAGVFGWITGEAFALDGWKPGEPNGTGSCGKIVASGEWWDHSCLDPLTPVCERE